MTTLEFVGVVAVGVLYGWLWADPGAKLLAPLKWVVNRALTRPVGTTNPPRRPNQGAVGAAGDAISNVYYSLVRTFGGPKARVARSGRVAGWVRHRFDCPVCMGFDASLAATWHFTRDASWGLLVWPAAAAGVHLAWQHTLGVARDLAEAASTLADKET